MKFSVDWWSQHIPNWEKYILPIMADRKEIEVLEIGSFEGRSTVWICENLIHGRGSYLTVIDTFEGSPEHKEMGIQTKNLREIFDDNTSMFKEKISVFVGRSQDVLKESGFDQPWYDLVYVDGSHVAADVYEDAVLTWKALKHGGVAVFDDYLWEMGETENDRPKKGIDKFITEHTGKMRIVHLDYQAIIQKM